MFRCVPELLREIVDVRNIILYPEQERREAGGAVLYCTVLYCTVLYCG